METTNTETTTTSSNTGNELLRTGWQLVPRKIIGGLAAMWLISSAASELNDLPLKQFALVIVCMFLLGLAAIGTHYLLERGSKEKPKKEVIVTPIDAELTDADKHVIDTVLNK